jgi:cell division protease FtsH
MKLEMTDEALEFAVNRSGEFVEGALPGTRYSGDHLNALCRTLARIRLREGLTRPTEVADIERALMEWVDRPQLTAKEERVVATHEAGHAVVSLFCEHAEPIDRISIRGDLAGSLGYVKHQDPAHKYVATQAKLLDDLCVLMGGREAESLLMGDVSIGCAGDLEHATSIAETLVEVCGLGGDDVGPVYFRSADDLRKRRVDLSPGQLDAIDRSVRQLLADASRRAASLLRENQPIVELLRDELLKHKVLEAQTLSAIVGRDKARPSAS